MKLALRIAGALAAVALVFVAITWLALEQSDVAIIETHAPDGTTRRTHVWIVYLDGGTTWLEAGNPDNAWFADLKRDRRLRLTVYGVTRDTTAEIIPGESPMIRAAMRAKYGWRDAWIQMLVNADQATAVRIANEFPVRPPKRE